MNSSLKRKLFTLSIFLTCAGGTAAEGLSVYGVADVGVQVSRFGLGNQVLLASGAEDGSRIGFKGEEDLGSGFKALVQLESRVELDTGAQSNTYPSPGINQSLLRGLPAPVGAALTSAILLPPRAVNSANGLFDRQAFVGLITPVGAVLLGRQYTPGYEVFHGADVFESGSAGTWGNLLFINGNGVTPAISIRYSNAIQYRIKLDNGLGASAMYAPEETGTLNVGKRAWGTNVTYKANGLDVGLGFNAEQDQAGRRALRTLTAGGSYSLDNWKVFAGFASSKNDNPAVAGIVAPAIGPVFAAIFGENARVDGNLYTLGGQYAVGTGRVRVGLSHFKNKRTADANATLAAVGYDHYLSKRTNLYSVFAHVRNGAQAQGALGGSGYIAGATSAPGQGGNALQVGVRHLF